MQCIFQRRTMPVAIAVKKAIEEGKFGKIVLADAYLKYYRDQAYYNSAGWRGTWELDGGGALMNQGVHGVDLILWMLGDQVKSLFGRAETLSRKIVVEDTAAAILKMDKGAICVIEGATTVYPGESTTFAIHGEKGTVIFNDSGIVEWEFIDKEDAPVRPDRVGESIGGAQSAINIGVSGHVQLLRDLALAVMEDREPMIPPREATTAVKVICSIYESTRTGKEIFRQGPFEDGTNNVGEFLALVHGLALLKQQNSSMTICSDSRNAMAWVRDKKCKTKLVRTEKNAKIFELIARAEKWLAENTYPNRLVKWETKEWGEIPADFGRK